MAELWERLSLWCAQGNNAVALQAVAAVGTFLLTLILATSTIVYVILTRKLAWVAHQDFSAALRPEIDVRIEQKTGAPAVVVTDYYVTNTGSKPIKLMNSGTAHPKLTRPGRVSLVFGAWGMPAKRTVIRPGETIHGHTISVLEGVSGAECNDWNEECSSYHRTREGTYIVVECSDMAELSTHAYSFTMDKRVAYAARYVRPLKVLAGLLGRLRPHAELG